jgi:SAM-dependent methyltransferase
MPERSTSSDGCIVCGSPLRPLLEKGGQRYCRCVRCGHIAIDPLPPLDEQLAFYRRQYESGVYRDYLEARPLKLQTFDRRLDSILAIVPRPKRVLDVGCASGAFVEAARRRGLDAFGVEAVASAVEAAPATVRPFLLVRDVERDPVEGGFDLITFFDVIEHMRDPRGFLERVRALLTPGGAIALTCPDREHFLRTLMGARWPHYQPFQHFHLFGRSDLRTFLQDGGFDVLVERGVGKVLSYGYLTAQLQANNPVLSAAMRLAGRLLPPALRGRPIEIGIGEMLAVARLRDAKRAPVTARSSEASG